MPPAENVRQIFIRIPEDGAPPGGGGTYFFKDSTGLAEFLRINGLAEQSVDLFQGHESVERDRVHIHPAISGARPVCRGSSAGAPAEIVLSGSVEVLQGVGGLRNARIVIAVEETFGVPPGYLLGMLDETPESGAAPALWRLSALPGEECE